MPSSIHQSNRRFNELRNDSQFVASPRNPGTKWCSQGGLTVIVGDARPSIMPPPLIKQDWFCHAFCAESSSCFRQPMDGDACSNQAFFTDHQPGHGASTRRPLERRYAFAALNQLLGRPPRHRRLVVHLKQGRPVGGGDPRPPVRRRDLHAGDAAREGKLPPRRPSRHLLDLSRRSSRPAKR